MKVGYWTLLSAVVAIVLIPAVAWGAVTVLEDFDDGETKVNLFEWAPFTADNVTISEDTPNGEGYSNEILIDAWGGYDDCYFSVLPDDVYDTDLSGGSYINFYMKATGNIDLLIFQCYGEDWFPGLSAFDSDPLPTEWTYYSFALTDFTTIWGDGDPAVPADFEAIWQVEWYWMDETTPEVTVYVDYVTLTDTPEEGEIGEAAPEVSASITGPHNVDPGDSVVLTAVAEGFDEGTETYLWNDASTAATLDLGVVDAGATGVYTCTVSGDAGGEAADPVEASFTLWVGVATPLAGGLGLGLLAGACALAGVVCIRRKK